MMQNAGNSVAKTVHCEREPVTLLKRIGSTTYKVNVHFSENNTENLEDKLLQLLLQKTNAQPSVADARWRGGVAE